jgi:putative hydrolase of the HAD superfamily
MAMEKNIRNIIFDLGNVLVNLDGQRCIDAFRKIGGEDLAKTIKEHQLQGLFLDTEVGYIDEHIFCERIRKLAGKPLTDEEIVWAWNELLTGIPDEKKARLLELRKKYKVFLLSNTNEMHWRKCAEDFFPYGPYGTEDYFDRVFLSYEMHLIKPDEKIFRETLSQAGLKAEETLFIDDRKENCEGAAKVGIQTFLNAEPDDWMDLR